MSAKQIKTPTTKNVSGPYSQMVCHDCGKRGCLIPVPHKAVN